MGTTFGNQDPRAGVRDQLCKGSQQRIHNEIHAQVLCKRQGGFTQCIGFGPGRFGFGKVFSNLVFCLFLGGDFLRSPYKAENLPGTVSYREPMHFDPALFPLSTEDAEPFIELASLSSLLKSCKHMHAVFGVDEVLIGGWIIDQ